MKIHCLSLIACVLALSSYSFAQSEQTSLDPRKRCPTRTLRSESEVPPLSSYEEFFKPNGVSVLTENMHPAYLEIFVQSYHKIPAELKALLKAYKARINLLEGESVIEDPSWKEIDHKTHDGRNWSEVSASGGSAIRKSEVVPTRIVVNRILGRFGTADVVLHELAHNIDYLDRQNIVSGSKQWNDLLAKEPNSSQFLSRLCENDYCKNSKGEGFAELFAYYHACDVTRNDMVEKVPAIAKFFEMFTSLKGFKELK